MPDFVVASATATQEEMDHAVSPDWRTPLPVKDETKAEPAKAEGEEAASEVSEEEAKTAPGSEPEIQQEEDKPTKGKGGFQKKIDKLTSEKKAALERNERLEGELAEFKERFKAIEDRLAKPAVTEEKKPEVKTSDGKPLESEIGTKYKDWTEYNEALIDWKADRRLEARLAERDEQTRTSQEQETQATREATYKEAAKTFAEKTPDFNEAISAAAKAGMKLPVPILERIQELSNGPEVTYYLVTNPDEALALVEADPVEGFMMLGRISYGLELEAKTEPPKPPAKKPISGAPEPVKPVTGHSARSGNSLQEISARSNDEYIRTRRAQMVEKERAGRR